MGHRARARSLAGVCTALLTVPRDVGRRKTTGKQVPEMPFSFGVRKPIDLDPAHEREVLMIFAEAVKAGKPKVECYSAAAIAWQRLHPGQRYSGAANIAVCIVLDRVLSRSAEMRNF